jgi:hypothetical protein
MVSTVPAGALRGETGVTRSGRRPVHTGAAADFRSLVARSLQAHRAVAGAGHSGMVRPAAFSSALPGPRLGVGVPPVAAGGSAALDRAMALENVPTSWKSGLRFIMAQESGGRVDARSPVHSAHGLFQLTAANYGYNPHGAASFGNGVEEAQGGIRYIRQRYGTADNAVQFWQSHHWY